MRAVNEPLEPPRQDHHQQWGVDATPDVSLLQERERQAGTFSTGSLNSKTRVVFTKWPDCEKKPPAPSEVPATHPKNVPNPSEIRPSHSGDVSPPSDDQVDHPQQSNIEPPPPMQATYSVSPSTHKEPASSPRRVKGEMEMAEEGVQGEGLHQREGLVKCETTPPKKQHIHHAWDDKKSPLEPPSGEPGEISSEKTPTREPGEVLAVEDIELNDPQQGPEGSEPPDHPPKARTNYSVS